MVHYKLIKITINALGLVEVIIDMIVWHYGIPELIITDWGLLFISKFWFLLYCFLGIKSKLSTVFYPQTDGQIKRQNNTIDIYLRVFINWEQDDWAKLLPIVEFAYNNAKNTNIGHTLFELNYSYHPSVFFKEDVDFHLISCSANELTEKLRELIEVCCQNLLYAQEL